MKMDTWEKMRNEEYFGQEQIESEGVIHEDGDILRFP